MSTRRSPFYTALAILFSLIVLAGGAAKLYRGFNSMAQSGQSPAVRELLEKSDAAAAEANKKSEAASPAFDELLGDFDKLGITSFRAEKREACAKVTEQFNDVSKELEVASKSLIGASKQQTNEKLNKFILSRSKSYDLLVEANKKNVEIVSATLDESLIDANAVLVKIEAIAASRSAIQSEALQASAAADELLKQR